ncbi:MAG: ABC transporter permease [Dehalococcoidia bacterium]|nr:ABC transporter permease [Dehalococcoidia bacterium]
MGPGLAGYTIRRLLWAIPVLFVISILVFWMLRLAPGDPAETILGNRFDEEQANVLRRKYGYDQPVAVQYGKYIWNLAHLDLGVSVKYRDFSVTEVILPKLWVSSRLGVLALVISFGLGIPVGVYAALARGTFLDPLTISSWLLLDAIPPYVLIPLVQWALVLKLKLFGLGWEGFLSPNMILPVLVMGLPGVAGVARLMRASVIGVLSEDYIRTARAKGLKEQTIIVSHITRNALLPMVTVIGLSLPGVAAGALFVETLFGIPGIGQLSLEAVQLPDFDVVLALILFGSASFVLANVLIDVMYAFIDPRIRVGGARG